MDKQNKNTGNSAEEKQEIPGNTSRNIEETGNSGNENAMQEKAYGDQAKTGEELKQKTYGNDTKTQSSQEEAGINASGKESGMKEKSGQESPGKGKTKTVKYKTNVKCQDCVDKVKSQLDDTDSIEAWTIDLDNPDALLTIVMDEEGDVAVIETIFTDAGFSIEPCGCDE